MSEDPAADRERLREALTHRFGDAPDIAAVPADAADALAAIAKRGSVRRFSAEPVAPSLIETLAAVALASPSKSDMQQRDIIIVRDPGTRAKLNALMAGQAWIANAPAMLVFCANNRRQRLIHDWRGHAFANDHLDAFFNASVEAGIALATFVIAAERAGLGCCPISAIRNEAAKVSEILGLPDHVFPVAGLGVGWPAAPAAISPRLALAATVHVDRYRDDDIRAVVDGYDARRAAIQPFARQRDPERFGTAEHYGWSEDKARQYADPERADFGAFIRAKGFKLD